MVTTVLGEGSRASPSELCRHLYPRLVGSFYLYLGDLALAEEVAQEALSRLVEHWPKVQGMAHPEAWTWRVGFNLATSSLRRRSAERRAHARLANRAVHQSGGWNSDLPDPADVLAVRAAVASLAARQRQAVVLRYYGDLPLAEIASVMGCKTGTVKAHLHKALIALRGKGLVDDELDPLDTWSADTSNNTAEDPDD